MNCLTPRPALPEVQQAPTARLSKQYGVLLPNSRGWRLLVLSQRLVLGAAAVPGRIEAPGVADRHCALESAAGGVRVTDLGFGPTHVGSREVRARPQLAQPGEIVRLGRVPAVIVQVEPSSHGCWCGIAEFGAWSPLMWPVLAELALLAEGELPLLLLGESGTGKEWAARALHRISPRAERPLVTVNCGALHGDLLLAELFGAERGAYTGCTERRKGAFERADGGTLMLDELGELPLTAQAALLRALETGEIQILGGAARTVNVRLLCATHRDLHMAVQQGTFRLDLLHRIDVAAIRLPPLRVRPEDTEGLLRRWWSGTDIDERLIHQLKAQPLHGNLRELRNLASRLQATARFGVPCLADLDAALGLAQSGGCVGKVLRTDADLIPEGLGVEQAWRASGLSRSTFFRRLRQLRQVAA